MSIIANLDNNYVYIIDKKLPALYTSKCVKNFNNIKLDTTTTISLLLLTIEKSDKYKNMKLSTIAKITLDKIVDKISSENPQNNKIICLEAIDPNSAFASNMFVELYEQMTPRTKLTCNKIISNKN